MRAIDCLTIRGSYKANGIANHVLYVFVVVGGEGLVAGLEIEDLAVAALKETSGAEDLASGECADHEDLGIIRDAEGLTVGLFVGKGEIAVDPLYDRMRGIGDPKDLGVARFAPAEIAGSAHKRFEGLGVVSGVEEDRSHAGVHRIANEAYNLIGNLLVCHMTPPDQNVGLVEHFFGDAAIFIVQCRKLDGNILATQEIGNDAVE